MTKSSREEKERCEKQLSETAENRKNEAARLNQKEQEINDCRDTVLKYKNEQVRLEAKTEKLSEEKKRLNDDMWENYEIT